MKEQIPTDSLSWGFALCESLERRIHELNKWQKKAEIAYYIPNWLCFLRFGYTKRQLARKVRRTRAFYFTDSLNNFSNFSENA